MNNMLSKEYLKLFYTALKSVLLLIKPFSVKPFSVIRNSAFLFLNVSFWKGIVSLMGE